VSHFVLSPEIEDRNAVEVDNWAKHMTFKTKLKQMVDDEEVQKMLLWSTSGERR
jgi:hypothetical protein